LSWCDKLASVPSVGVGLEWHFATGNAILDTLAPLLNKSVDKNKQTFTVIQPDAFSLQIIHQDGIFFGFEASKAFVGFQHRLQVKPVSGGLPRMQMLSQPHPFTMMLPVISRKLLELVALLPGVPTRKITRVGIVSTTYVDLDQVPPGIGRLVRHMTSPWAGAVDNFSFNIVAELDRSSGWTDRCVHIVVKPEDPDELPTLTLDWQRTFTKARSGRTGNYRKP
jgi:hypothetical protein